MTIPPTFDTKATTALYGVRSDTGRAEPSDTTSSDATFVRCDTTATFALLTDDVEFYHDRTGLHEGPQVRADFARLAESCPRTRGIARRLVPNTLRVYPISGYSAVQVGVHEFVERGALNATTPGSCTFGAHHITDAP